MAPWCSTVSALVLEREEQPATLLGSLFRRGIEEFPRMPIESEIRARVDAFAADLVSLIKASAMDVVQEALGEGAPARGRRRGPGRPPRAASRRPKGAKRDPKVLEALTEKLVAFIKKNPGQRIEQIGKALSVATKELALPVKKLIAAKKASTKGQKRATTYYPR
jgi:hypothetical protein